MKPFVFKTVLYISFRLEKGAIVAIVPFYCSLKSVISLAMPLKRKKWKGNMAYQ